MPCAPVFMIHTTGVLVHKGGGIGQPGDHFKNFMRPDSSYFNSTLIKNGIETKTKGYCSDVYTQAAIEYLDQKAEEGSPFFIYLPFNAPHTPLQVPGEYLEMYEDLIIDRDKFPSEGTYPEMTSRDHDYAKRVYAMVSNIDDNLSRLFNKLLELELIDNTLIIFLTDNGPQQSRYVAGLNGRKGSVLEGGIRVPCFWYWKGHFASNYEVDEVAANIDILPTIAEICGIELPAGLDIDGRSLLPLLYRETEVLPERTIFFEWQRGFPQPYRNMAARKGDYKLVGPFDYEVDKEELQLFDINKDPFELNNIKQVNPEIVQQMKKEFDEWYDEIIRNENLVHPPRIIIGTEHENPVVLGRNDWKGPGAMRWGSADAFGYWDITIARDGLYDVKLEYKDNFQNAGRGFVRAGTVQRNFENRDTTTNVIELDDVPFIKGDFMLEAWCQVSGMAFTPIYVEILLKQ